MRISRPFAAAIVLSVLTPIAASRAATISPGNLMYTDLFLWPNWREILAKYDCTTELNFYLTNAPPSAQVIITPPSVLDPVVVGSPGGAIDPPPTGTPGGGSGGTPIGPVGPIGTPGGDPPGVPTAVPELSTWAMLLLGFVGLSYAGFRRTREQEPFRTPA
jgi:hypothetical protein